MYQKSAQPQQERLNWLRLSRSQNVGSKTFINLIKIYGTATNALEMIKELAIRGGAKKEIIVPSLADIELEFERVTNYGASLILACDPEFPQLMLKIDDYPAAITVKGNQKLLNSESIGIVGARNASTNGCSFAKKISSEFSSRGITVVSGLARGIDTYAHKGSDADKTIAVIAGGIDHIYPKENQALYEAISANGLVVAELPIGSAPIAKHFPQRNRIISGLSKAVVVVEAAENSGSLITANYAKLQNKKVFAVPGSPFDERCKGTNNLIKNGAGLLQSAQDVIDYLNRMPKEQSLFDIASNYNSPLSQIPTEDDLTEHRKDLLETLGFSPTSIDEIVATLGIPIPILTLLIIELELAGKVERLYGNKLVRIG
jgi:DNA processing protein